MVACAVRMPRTQASKVFMLQRWASFDDGEARAAKRAKRAQSAPAHRSQVLPSARLMGHPVCPVGMCPQHCAGSRGTCMHVKP